MRERERPTFETGLSNRRSNPAKSSKLDYTQVYRDEKKRESLLYTYTSPRLLREELGKVFASLSFFYIYIRTYIYISKNAQGQSAYIQFAQARARAAFLINSDIHAYNLAHHHLDLIYREGLFIARARSRAICSIELLIVYISLFFFKLYLIYTLFFSMYLCSQAFHPTRRNYIQCVTSLYYTHASDASQIYRGSSSFIHSLSLFISRI